MKNANNVFNDSIIDLCKTLTPEKIKELDYILTQEKEESEIIKNIIEKFPNFQIIYASKLSE
ncbi:hypothetical protein A2773_00025 [Candidatus Gottesmanbacteria bacterium RIFCSPHIGHO2_01_FULL_39_10]|uniref:Uncharacterized protein n=1 Tax=Candidatus Gottesmanbacteria bacterium RIFCSPHIGHO2_01_FULL_39_10 TaxID=1798375 RepID=A0A1F5ZP49_9BACT|nr:MAG: hypothetical protein A2773_00025 [Candidatus Gottesmanbacteria bacterium RIFCSPHIGHO2_01_FULL_39_10]